MTDLTLPAADAATKIKRNAEIARKSISTYVVHAVSLGAAILLALGPDWVTAFIQQHWAVSTAGPVVSLAFWWIAKLTPQDITLQSDKEKAIRDWVLGIAAKLMPGQAMALPPEIAKASGLPDVVRAPVVPAPVDTSLPMPGTAVMGSLRNVVAPKVPANSAKPVEAPAVLTPVELRNQFESQHPEWTPMQLDAVVQAYSAPL